MAFPARGRAIALTALDAAERIDVLPSARFEGSRRGGYRITVDEDRSTDITRTEDRPAGPETDVVPPTIDVWPDEDDDVRRGR